MRCLWCTKKLTVEEPAYSELCSGCQQISTGIPGLSTELLDILPFGVIHLNREGTILAFNRAEENLSGLSDERVVGRNFFTEIAPCADVREFRGRFERFLDGDELSEQFSYVYAFKDSTVRVQLAFIKVNQRLAFLLSRRESV